MSFEILQGVITTIQPLIRGTNREQKIELYQSKQNLISFTGLTGSSIYFYFRKTIEDTVNIFTKKNTTAGGDDSQIKINTSSSLSIFFDSTDSENLSVFNYLGILKIVTSDSKIYKHYLEIPII